MTEISKGSANEITQDWLKQFAEASGDHNPIHQNEEAAKKMGLPGVIAHGMLIASLVADRAEEFARGHSRDLNLDSVVYRFRSMTFLGEKISVEGKVKEETDTEIKVELQASNEGGEIKAIGRFTYKINS